MIRMWCLAKRCGQSKHHPRRTDLRGRCAGRAHRHCYITAKGAFTMPEGGKQGPQGRPRTVTNPASKGMRRGLYASRWTSFGKPIA